MGDYACLAKFVRLFFRAFGKRAQKKPKASGNREKTMGKKPPGLREKGIYGMVSVSVWNGTKGVPKRNRGKNMGGVPLMKNRRAQNAGYLLALTLLLCVGGFFLYYGLENQMVMNYDEARHGINAYEMIRNDDYVTHTFQGQPDYWNLKPPLSYWLIALSYKLFGYSVAAFRLEGTVSMLLLLLAVALWTRKRHGNLCSLLTLLFLVINPVLYRTHAGRSGDADAVYLLFTTIGLLCMLSSDRNLRWLYGTALGFGFAFMAKGMHAALIPFICLLYLCFTGQIKQLRVKHYALLVFFGLLPIVPWAVLRYQRDGLEFFVKMFTTDVQARMAAEVDGVEGQWYFFLWRIVNNPVAIGSLLMAGAGLFTLLKRRLRPTKEHIGLLLWIVAPVLVFSFSGYKLHHYIFPMMMPLAIAAGLTAAAFFREKKRGPVLAVFCAALGLAVGLQLANDVYEATHKTSKSSYEIALADMLDRDVDSGRHMYIQYSPKLTRWAQSDMLVALMEGDVVCKDGGVEGFLQDEEDALVVVSKDCFDQSLLEEYPLFYESVYLYVLENY